MLSMEPAVTGIRRDDEIFADSCGNPQVRSGWPSNGRQFQSMTQAYDEYNGKEGRVI